MSRMLPTWLTARLPQRRTAASVTEAARRAAAPDYVRISEELAASLSRIVAEATKQGAFDNSGVIEAQVREVGRATQQKIMARVDHERSFRREARLQVTKGEAEHLRRELRDLVESDFKRHREHRKRIEVAFDGIREDALRRADQEAQRLPDEDFVASLPGSPAALVTFGWQHFGLVGGAAAVIAVGLFALGRWTARPGTQPVRLDNFATRVAAPATPVAPPPATSTPLPSQTNSPVAQATEPSQ